MGNKKEDVLERSGWCLKYFYINSDDNCHQALPCTFPFVSRAADYTLKVDVVPRKANSSELGIPYPSVVYKVELLIKSPPFVLTYGYYISIITSLSTSVNTFP